MFGFLPCPTKLTDTGSGVDPVLWTGLTQSHVLLPFRLVFVEAEELFSFCFENVGVSFGALDPFPPGWLSPTPEGR